MSIFNNIISSTNSLQNFASVTRYLEPLAVAANITQASFCRMDQVLLTFGFLVMKYQDPKMDQDTVARDAIIKSIESRWAKSDQELFVASVIVNPFYTTMPFNPESGQWLSMAELRALFSRLHRRFYSKEPSTLFFEHLIDFFKCSTTGYFRRLPDQIKHDLTEATKKVHILNQFMTLNLNMD